VIVIFPDLCYDSWDRNHCKCRCRVVDVGDEVLVFVSVINLLYPRNE
jgi:hypothetical protein